MVLLIQNCSTVVETRWSRACQTAEVYEPILQPAANPYLDRFIGDGDLSAWPSETQALLGCADRRPFADRRPHQPRYLNDGPPAWTGTFTGNLAAMLAGTSMIRDEPMEKHTAYLHPASADCSWHGTHTDVILLLGVYICC